MQQSQISQLSCAGVCTHQDTISAEDPPDCLVGDPTLSDGLLPIGHTGTREVLG